MGNPQDPQAPYPGFENVHADHHQRTRHQAELAAQQPVQRVTPMDLMRGASGPPGPAAEVGKKYRSQLIVLAAFFALLAVMGLMLLINKAL
ncbi:hypothetical protein J4573_44985 [Actinomadura barringtoniae]|uniref:Uncharacterized protein n=1 Tax=Actinomadura barringtoniae TaxID=1427535 RepID=A0A939PQD8_9ACTN|nr:hypothetical protein [Actinomadura barringtoniae]MBO2454308.1 hypothetical protein [Actinomadura barringtoniae]